MRSEPVTAVTIALVLLLVLVPIATGSAVASVGSSGDGSPLTKFHLHFTLTSPNAQNDGYFGYSVANSGKLAVVGASTEAVDGYYAAGHAYVYNTLTGRLVQTLTSPNAQYEGWFGYTVAVTGELAVIGAPLENASGYYEAGHAYVYNAATGELLQTLTSPNAQEYGDFGASVAVSGKLAVVGATGETASGYSDAGHAYVYDATTGKLLQTLTSPNAQAGGHFGHAVGVSGKLAVIGAPEESTGYGYSEAGHAYVYNTSTGLLLQNLTSPNAQASGLFGNSVAISGDLAVIGAPFETADGYSYAGHEYVYDATAGKLKLVQTLTSPNAQTDGFFGDSAAISGKTAVMGAPGETADGYGLAGHAYAYDDTAGKLKLVQTLTSPNAQTLGAFGLSVAVSGDLAVVGAPYEAADGYSEAGHAYIYD